MFRIDFKFAKEFNLSNGHTCTHSFSIPQQINSESGDHQNKNNSVKLKNNKKKNRTDIHQHKENNKSFM